MKRQPRFNDLLKIQQATETNSSGSIAKTWSTYDQVYGRVEALRGREYFDAQVVQSDLSHKVTMYYRSGITPKMRIAWGSRTLQIESVMAASGRERTLTLMCVEKDV